MRSVRLILAVESSCDESAVALVRDDGAVLAERIASQSDLHAATGGVVPEVAAREPEVAEGHVEVGPQVQRAQEVPARQRDPRGRRGHR
mgnify:CR=1 FL=1